MNRLQVGPSVKPVRDSAVEMVVCCGRIPQNEPVELEDVESLKELERVRP